MCGRFLWLRGLRAARDQESLMAFSPLVEQILDGRLHVFHNGRWMAVPSGGDGPVEDPPAEPPEGEADPPAAAEGAAPDAAAEEVPPVEVPEDLTTLEESALRDLHAA